MTRASRGSARSTRSAAAQVIATGARTSTGSTAPPVTGERYCRSWIQPSTATAASARSAPSRWTPANRPSRSLSPRTACRSRTVRTVGSSREAPWTTTASRAAAHATVAVAVAGTSPGISPARSSSRSSGPARKGAARPAGTASHRRRGQSRCSGAPRGQQRQFGAAVFGDLVRNQHESGRGQGGQQGRRDVEAGPGHGDGGGQAAEGVVELRSDAEFARRPRTAEDGERDVAAAEPVGASLQWLNVAESQPVGIRYGEPERVGVPGQGRGRGECRSWHQGDGFGVAEGAAQVGPDGGAAAVRTVQAGPPQSDPRAVIGLHPQLVTGPYREPRGEHVGERGLDGPRVPGRARPAPRHQPGVPRLLLAGDHGDVGVVARPSGRLGDRELGGAAVRDP